MTLVLGASGQLGSALRELLPDADFLTRVDLDLTDPAAIRPALEKHRPEAIINCAAYNDVDGAETDEAAAAAVNGTAVGEMASYAAFASVPFITYSTDYVFDGAAGRPYVESDARNPLSAYGRSKALGEDLALSRHPASLVVRTSWLISGSGSDFVGKILARAAVADIRVVDDVIGCPTLVDDLARATIAALRSGATGLLHLVNEGTATWFELASAAAELAGIDRRRIAPCPSSEFPQDAPRPAYSVLASERRDGFGMAPLPHWRESLPKAVARASGGV